MAPYVQLGPRAISPDSGARAPLERRREGRPRLDVVLMVIGVALVSGFVFGELGTRAGPGASADHPSPLQHFPR